MTYRCQSDMNIAKWLNDMQRLYNSLCDLDTDCMGDHDFALTILDLMPQDDGWRDFVSGLRTKVHNADTQTIPIDSTTFITIIRDEYWYRHKDDAQMTSHIFTVRCEAQKRSNAPKRPCGDDLITATTSPPSPNKRPRNPNPEKAHLLCTNPHYGSHHGHELSDCLAYTGRKAGQYGPWWCGPWNIHLPKTLRSSDNNMPPKSHPQYKQRSTPSVNQSLAIDNSVDRSSTSYIKSKDSSTQPETNSALTSDSTYHVWSTHSSDNVVLATLPILNHNLPRDNSCHHDSGANRHVFHDRTIFGQYKSIPPLTVKGFGQNLSATAIG
jgi:hypothetical protein